MSGEVVADTEVLNEIALTILDDEGQVAVADMLAQGDVFQAQIMLVRVAYQQYQAGELTEADYRDIVARTGMSERAADNIADSFSDRIRLWD